MNYIKTFATNINPLKKNENSSRVEYVIQKALAFFMIYIISAIVAEGIIMLLFTFLGYDFLNGEMPTGWWVDLLPLYGFIGFGINTFFYVKVIEKKELRDIELYLNRRSLWAFIRSFFLGGLLVSIAVGCLWGSGRYAFEGFGDFNWQMFIMGLLAYGIQGAAEEVMCRGFLFHSLKQKTGNVCATLISTLAFIFPHLSSLGDMDRISICIAILNLILVSILFSFQMIKDGTLLSACGIHVGWNFVLAYIYGISVSGSGSNYGIMQFRVNTEECWLTGGAYGIEASAILVPLFLTLNIIYANLIRRKKVQHEILQ